MIHVVPTFIGDGIPLVDRASRTVELELLDTKTWPDDVVKLHYRVIGQKRKRTSRKRH